MRLEHVKNIWNTLGEKDPLWAILTDYGKKGNKWKEKEFFLTGEREIAEAMNELKKLHLRVKRNAALDFGCGAGRLTQPLAKRFKRVNGVDIAQSMITLANKHNRFANCHYLLNTQPHLAIFADNSFDFIYSNITLQHMEPVYIEQYLKEFLRILSPNGILLFQLPSKPAKTLKGLLIRIIPSSLLTILRRGMEMHGIKRDKIIALLQRYEGEVLHSKENKNAGNGWLCYDYVVRRK